ncbi:aminoglycoside phosphotransferase family protein [Streptomyces sp. NRRL F-5126]|uniref:aminoglycoside phosphotransferase family protein n=1 Tax=Streptomyces sp. NRRL F-5126 TaxID=1463857 RepID=UPI000B1EB847|nr:aminoglycoside phosphotransferase family protein [Streptomyces sp. NRRL F-5126]
MRLVVEGPCRGGQVGAAYVRWEDGRRSVLSWRPGTALDAMRAGPLAVSETLRSGGSPCPAVELSAQVGPDVVLVQELLPGGPVGMFGHAALDRALAWSEAMAGRLAGRADIPPVLLHLRGDGPGFCLHGPLRRHGPRGTALERRIRAVAPGPESQWDAVHFDFHPGNMLAAPGGPPTGVIDWDGAGRGDRRLDLVTLRFGLEEHDTEPGVVERLDALLDEIEPDVLRPLWAHMSLRMADWAIRHFAPGDVDRWLDLAETRLGPAGSQNVSA